MTDARSRVNGCCRHESGRVGGGGLYIFIWNGTTGIWSNPLGVGTALKAGLAAGSRGFLIEYDRINNRAIIVYSIGVIANPQFALVAQMSSAI